MEKGKTIGVAKVGVKNRVVVPPEVLESLRLRYGDFVAFGIEKDGKIVMKKINFDD